MSDSKLKATGLKASAKEFVPSFNLHASAPSWTPNAPAPPVVTPPASKTPAPAASAPKPAAAKASAPAPASAAAPADTKPQPAPKKTAASIVAAPAPASAKPTMAEMAAKAPVAKTAAAPAPAPAAAAKKPAPAAAPKEAAKPAPGPPKEAAKPVPVLAAAAPAPAAAAAVPAPAPKATGGSVWGAKGGLSSAVRAAPPPMPAPAPKPLRTQSKSGGKAGGKDGKDGKKGGKESSKGGREGGKRNENNGKQQQSGRGRDGGRGGDRKGDNKDGKKGQGGRQDRQKSGGGRDQGKDKATSDKNASEKTKAPAPAAAAPAPAKNDGVVSAAAIVAGTAAAPKPKAEAVKPAPTSTTESEPAAKSEAPSAPAAAPAFAAAAPAPAPAPAVAAPAPAAAAPAPAPAAGGSWASLAKKPGVQQPTAQVVKQKPAQKPAQGQQRQQSHGKGRDQNHGRPGQGHGHDGNKQQQNNNSGWQRGNRLPADLCKPGEGKDDVEKAVTRYVAKDLLAMRLSFLAPPLSWGDSEPGAPDACKWDDPKRISEIDAMAKAPRMGGDVGLQQKRRRSQHHETAPPLEDCKPLEVNDETRWKAGVFKKDGKTEDEDSDEVIIKKALLILNKLSLTKFDKLSDDFIATGIGRNEKILHDVIWTIVNKAQDEPHFASMYAQLCFKLNKTPMECEAESAKKNKKFKSLLLERCQEEFETNTEEKIKKATEGIDDEEEKAYKAGIVKKHYLGHMRFIGELYKGGLISIKIMLFCLPALLEGDTAWSESGTEASSGAQSDSDEIDEEKVECFAKLMTTIGSSLEEQSMNMKSVGKTDPAERLDACWTTVERMAGVRKDGHVPSVSNRIKFMLQDLLEMRRKGWVTRRKEETAKTIAQIHKEVAKEEKAARRSSSQANLRRMGSSGDVRRQSASAKPVIDKDGFVQVQPASSNFGRSVSMGNMKRNSSRGSFAQSPRNVKSVMKKIPSANFPPTMEAPGAGQQQRKPEEKKSAPPAPSAASAPKAEAKSPDECGDKAKNILKEYFVGGDTDDAVLSFEELILIGQDGSVERGAKMIESSVLLVLEMKKDDVDKTLAVLSRIIDEKKIESAALSKGLNDPLEFLSDIAIDAPLAGDHLANIVSSFVKSGAISLDFLLNAPDYFRTDGKAAHFAAKVLKKMDATEDAANLEVVEKLMTEDDKKDHASAKDLVGSC